MTICSPAPELPPTLDAGQAGQLWRKQTLDAFEEKLKALGIEKDAGSEFASLRDQIASLTAELDDLYVRQENPEETGEVKQWWHDGEYDEGRADAWNDEGLAACREGKGEDGVGAASTSSVTSSYGRAYDCFTEAIRLWPRSAVYHCNRSLVALKLGRCDLALEDAKNAISRRAGYSSAYLRAGKACLGLGDGVEAGKYFEMVLAIDDGCKAAAKGLNTAKRLVEERARQEEANAVRGDTCSRKRLPSSAEDMSGGVLEDAAMRLIAAEDMLRAVGAGQSYKVQGAMYEKAECLILLGRYSDATAFLTSVDGLGSSDVAETRYLRAETAWRQGDLDGALVLLKGMERVEKCAVLQNAVGGYLDALTRVRSLLGDGMDSEAIMICDELMMQDGISPSVCAGLVAIILRCRAKGYCQQRRWGEAQKDLDACLEMDAEDVESMRERADVLRERGLYTEYFLSLQELKRVSPGMAGLAALIRDAARLASTDDSRARGNHVGGRTDPSLQGSKLAAGSISSFETLGVARGATMADVRRSYLKLAAKWHPDKWVGKEAAEIQAAEAKFKAVKDAYEDLLDN